MCVKIKLHVCVSPNEPAKRSEFPPDHLKPITSHKGVLVQTSCPIGTESHDPPWGPARTPSQGAVEFETLGVEALPHAVYDLTFETLGLSDSFTVSMRECVEGEYLDGAVCRPCTAGSFFDDSGGIADVANWCRPCPAGSYNSQV